MYKMIAVDLDGTMLNSYGEVTENTKRVIKQTIQKGTEVIIASGRSIDSIKTIANEIGSTKYMIAGNGAVVYDIKNDKIVYEKYIPKNNTNTTVAIEYLTKSLPLVHLILFTSLETPLKYLPILTNIFSFFYSLKKYNNLIISQQWTHQHKNVFK